MAISVIFDREADNLLEGFADAVLKTHGNENAPVVTPDNVPKP